MYIAFCFYFISEKSKIKKTLKEKFLFKHLLVKFDYFVFELFNSFPNFVFEHFILKYILNGFYVRISNKGVYAARVPPKIKKKIEHLGLKVRIFMLFGKFVFKLFKWRKRVIFDKICGPESLHRITSALRTIFASLYGPLDFFVTNLAPQLIWVWEIGSMSLELESSIRGRCKQKR